MWKGFLTKLLDACKLITWTCISFTGMSRPVRYLNVVDCHSLRPVAFKEPGPNGEIRVDYELTENPLPTWKKLEEMVAKGKVRNIGVSKYEFVQFHSTSSTHDTHVLEIVSILDALPILRTHLTFVSSPLSIRLSSIYSTHSPLLSSGRKKTAYCLNHILRWDLTTK
jgi:hypothetical protein